MSQSRVFSTGSLAGFLAFLALFFFAFAAMIDQRLLASCDGRNDGHFIAILQRSLTVLEEADVFFVHIDVDETANFPGFVDQSFFDSRVLSLEGFDGGTDCCCFDFDDFGLVGELS